MFKYDEEMEEVRGGIIILLEMSGEDLKEGLFEMDYGLLVSCCLFYCDFFLFQLTADHHSQVNF